MLPRSQHVVTQVSFTVPSFLCLLPQITFHLQEFRVFTVQSEKDIQIDPIMQRQLCKGSEL